MSALKDPRQHDDLLNYKLKRLVSLGGAPAIRLCEGGHGLPRTQWRVLAALMEDGPMAIGDVLRRTHMESGKLSRALAGLIDKGLVARTAVAGDARRATVGVTEHGKALHASLWPQLAAINRKLAEVLSEEEALLLEALLARLTEHATRIHAEGGGVAVKTGRHLGGARRAAIRPQPAA
jgi:DNA-binding MarR family transcriptional regulator